MEHSSPPSGEGSSVHVQADNDLHIQDARIAGRDLTVTGEPARTGGGVVITIGGFTYRPRPAALLAAAVLATAVLLLAVLGLAALLGGR
jgi:hypothetical protein